MSKTSQLSTPCLISLTLTTLFLIAITITILFPTTSGILPHILPPGCPSQAPDPSQQTHGRIFNEHPELERITADDDSNEAKTWESILIPPSGGGIHSHTVPDSIHLNHSREGKILSWGISMFHQLHCLVALRALIFPETTERKVNSTSGAHTGDMALDRGHWAHCFDYIAQGILCAADDTIEPPRKAVDRHGKTLFDIDGVGAVHQCRDARVLWETSMRSVDEPMDMAGWQQGVGAREFLGQRVPKHRMDVPELYTLGMEEGGGGRGGSGG